MVARCKPPVVKVNHLPLKVNNPLPNNCIVTNGTNLKRSQHDLRELFYLSIGLLRTFADVEHRMLGSPMSTNAVIESIITADPQKYALNNHTDIVYLVDLWNRTCTNLEKTMRKNAQTYWTKQWLNETNKFVLPSNFKYLTDAQRHSMRRRKQGLQVPRTRCRCLSYDHFYVNDEKCPLYRNLRDMIKTDSVLDASSGVKDKISVLKHPSNDKDIASRSREMAKNLSRDLNTMEKACCDRLARTITEKENDIAEQQFMKQMEEVQRIKTNQSLSAPSLAAIVLSAVSALESEYGEKMTTLQVFNPKPAVDRLDDKLSMGELETSERAPSHSEVKDELADEDDDDDVPLMTLCKRRSEDRENPSRTKKQKCDQTKHISIHPWYMAKLAQYISTRWGHVYQEPSNEEYAW